MGLLSRGRFDCAVGIHHNRVLGRALQGSTEACQCNAQGHRCDGGDSRNLLGEGRAGWSRLRVPVLSVSWDSSRCPRKIISFKCSVVCNSCREALCYKTKNRSLSLLQAQTVLFLLRTCQIGRRKPQKKYDPQALVTAIQSHRIKVTVLFWSE